LLFCAPLCIILFTLLMLRTRDEVDDDDAVVSLHNVFFNEDTACVTRDVIPSRTEYQAIDSNFVLASVNYYGERDA